MRALTATLQLMLTLLMLMGTAHSLDRVSFNDVAHNAICNEEKRGIDVTIGARSYLVRLPALIETPIIGAFGACDLFIRGLKRVRRGPLSFQLTPFEAPPEEAEQESLSPPSYHSLELDEYCVQQGFCARDIFDAAKVNKQLLQCVPSPTLKELLFSPSRSVRSTLSLIPKVELSLYPLHTLAAALMRMRTSEKDTLVGAAMTIGDRTASELRAFFKANPANVLLALNARTLFSNMVPTERIALVKDGGLALFPITRHFKTWGEFHWKGIAKEGSNQSVLTSMNFSSATNNKFTDVLYGFDDQAVADELRLRIMQQIDNQCERQSEIRCLTRSLGEDPLTWTRSLDANCKKTESHRNQAGAWSTNYFLDTAETDPYPFLLSEIRRATESLVLVTNKFTDLKLAKALDAARKRGVHVEVISGFESPELNKFAVPHRWKNLEEFSLPNPHFRFIVIDQRRLVFGTANFSETGLNDSHELFAVTKDKTAIATALSYAHSYGASRAVSLITPDFTPEYGVLFSTKEDLASFRQRYHDYVERALPEQGIPSVSLSEAGIKAARACGLDFTILGASRLTDCLTKQEQKPIN